MILDSCIDEINDKYVSLGNNGVFDEFHSLIKKPFIKIVNKYHKLSNKFYHLTGW